MPPLEPPPAPPPSPWLVELAGADHGDALQGPALSGLFGRDIGSADGYAFSKATKDKSGEWNEETLDKFFLAPKKFIPGTKMVFAGMKKAPDRKDLIAFLKESCS